MTDEDFYRLRPWVPVELPNGLFVVACNWDPKPLVKGIYPDYEFAKEMADVLNRERGIVRTQEGAYMRKDDGALSGEDFGITPVVRSKFELYSKSVSSQSQASCKQVPMDDNFQEMLVSAIL